jgi:AcrR family transcriptional regulator
MEKARSSSSDGLRATKKDRTRAEILANAVALFRSQGIRRSRSNQIAVASSVSPATLFNYFPTKASIAEAWVRGEIERAFSALADDGGDHALRSIIRLACRDLAQLVDDDRLVRFEGWREAGRATLAPISAQHPIVTALAREQERDRVRADISAGTLAEMLLDAIESGLIAGLRSELAEPETGARELARSIQVRVDLVLDGARKRNERVAPSAVAQIP